MANDFLADIGKAIVIFATVYFCMGVYIFIKTKRALKTRHEDGRTDLSSSSPLAEVKKMFSSQLSLGLACVAGILSLLFVDSLPAILVIGGMFMGFFYLIFSKRP